MSAVSAEGFRFSDSLPELGNRTTAAVVSESLQRIEQLPCDIMLSPHPMFFGMDEKTGRIGKQSRQQSVCR